MVLLVDLTDEFRLVMYTAYTDLDVLSGVAQYVRLTLSKTEAWSAVLDEETYPASAVNTTDELNSWVKSTFQSQGHTTGTCSMLPQSDGGVVDSVRSFLKLALRHRC